MAPIKLTIFEDSTDFRESLVQLFLITPNVEIVGAYPDCSDLESVLQQDQPDVILMDIDMPGLNGIDATAIVKSAYPQVQVVMLTVSEEEDRIFQALRNGATGYMLKKSSPDDIIDSVLTVSKGESPISPAIARKVLQFFSQITPPGAAENVQSGGVSENTASASHSLTNQEARILEALVEGLSYKMIGNKLKISPDTVKNHIQGVYRKLHVNSKGEAISKALREGIVHHR